MKRRTMGLLITLALGLLVAPPAAVVQPMGKVPRIGVLVPGEAPSSQEPNLAAFRRALQHLGYREGQTIAVEYRYAHGEAARFGELAAELVARQVDIMVVGSGRAALAAKQATQTWPCTLAQSSPGNGWSCSKRRLRRSRTSPSYTTIQPIRSSPGTCTISTWRPRRSA